LGGREMATTPVRVAFRDEIERALGTITTAAGYHNNVAKVVPNGAAYEDFGERGTPGVTFVISGADSAEPAAYETVRMEFTVLFAGYTSATSQKDADEMADNLAHDIERAMWVNWQTGTSHANIHAASTARFIEWRPARVGDTVATVGGRGKAAVVDLEMTAIILRDPTTP